MFGCRRDEGRIEAFGEVSAFWIMFLREVRARFVWRMKLS